MNGWPVDIIKNRSFQFVAERNVSLNAYCRRTDDASTDVSWICEDELADRHKIIAFFGLKDCVGFMAM